MTTLHYAIKTGRRFTLVHVDLADNQCRVAIAPKVRKRYGNATTHLTVGGTSKAAIQRAATDGAGESFRTLRELHESVEGWPNMTITRAPGYDC